MDVRLTDVLVADAKLLADGLLQPEDDMAVFVGRGGKGRIAPFTVRRSYTGAGGWYVESMALLAPNGDVAWRGNEQPITLRGSSKIDLFSDDLHGVIVDSSDDHELVFLIGGDEVGRVPIAILDEDPPYATASPTDVLSEVLLSARSKDLQSLATTVEASARVIPASDPLFGKLLPILLPRRLNLRDGEGAADRWRKECTLVELTPSAIPAEA